MKPAVWFLPLALSSIVSRADGAEVLRDGRVLEVALDGLFVDVGASGGAAIGAAVVFLREGREIGRGEVIQVSSKSALVRVIPPAEADPRPGDQVRVSVTEASPATPPATREAASPTLRGPDEASGQEFVPLLVNQARDAARSRPTRNVFHGRLWARSLFQVENESSRSFSLFRLGSSGSIERLAGSRWSADWSGALSYRDGSGYNGSRDQGDVRPDVFRLSLVRPFGDAGFVRLGRFLPQELPSVGYLDGIQGEVTAAPALRLGAMAGLKPTRRDLDPSGDEPTAAAYATVAAGKPDELRYSGTVGLLGSLYKGKTDRLALLLDQRFSVAGRFHVYSSTAVDFDAGAAEAHGGTRFTRENLHAIWQAAQFLDLKAGYDRYERPDTAAERDAFELPSSVLEDLRYGRTWAGATFRLPFHLELGGEVGLLEGPEEDTIHWEGTLYRRGLWVWTDASVRAVVYNLAGGDAEGIGGRLTGYFPVLGGAFSLEPAVGFRSLRTSDTDTSFDVTDATVRGFWQVSAAWAVDAGVTYVLGDAVDLWLIDLGLELRW